MYQRANRALILDFNDEYGEPGIDVKSMAVEHIPAFMVHPKAEIRRIRPFIMSGGKWMPMSSSDMVSTLEKVITMYKGGGLVIEDPNKYLVDNVMPPDFTGKLISKRHSDLDLIMHYQSVARPLPIVWQNTNIIRYHCQMDPVLRSKSKLTELTEIFQIAELLVNHEYYDNNNQRFFVYVSRDTGTIIGDFTYQMFDAALDKHIMYNPSILRPYQIRYSMQGMGKLDAYNKSLRDCKDELLKKYWGNNKSSNFANSKREARTMLCTGRQGVGKTWETMRYLREDYCVNIAK
jgi:hypothetical protein